MRGVTGIGLAALIVAAATAALAADARIGLIKTVSGDAAVVHDGKRHPAKVGDPVYQSDVIETGPGGTIGITFNDNSVFSTGPGSQLALKDFHFAPGNSDNAMLADLRKGTLTIVSGEIPHSGPSAMQIKTPTAVLGIRGTTFAIEVH